MAASAGHHAQAWTSPGTSDASQSVRRSAGRRPAARVAVYLLLHPPGDAAWPGLSSDPRAGAGALGRRHVRPIGAAGGGDAWRCAVRFGSGHLARRATHQRAGVAQEVAWHPGRVGPSPSRRGLGCRMCRDDRASGLFVGAGEPAPSAAPGTQTGPDRSGCAHAPGRRVDGRPAASPAAGWRSSRVDFGTQPPGTSTGPTATAQTDAAAAGAAATTGATAELQQRPSYWSITAQPTRRAQQLRRT